MCTNESSADALRILHLFSGGITSVQPSKVAMALCLSPLSANTCLLPVRSSLVNTGHETGLFLATVSDRCASGTFAHQPRADTGATSLLPVAAANMTNCRNLSHRVPCVRWFLRGLRGIEEPALVPNLSRGSLRASARTILCAISVASASISVCLAL